MSYETNGLELKRRLREFAAARNAFFKAWEQLPLDVTMSQLVVALSPSIEALRKAGTRSKP